ncbi:MAG TPA: DUF3455 domain-containing protein [Blastocatellia bacterium]|nr:DUF3455 domain-containing protein [Blastocatellia bacterium]
MKAKRVIALVLLLTVAGAMPASVPSAQAGNKHAPDLPSPLCDRLQVPAGKKVAFHVYALGVQVYKWNGASWDFVAPVATLSADADYNGDVGIHYAGPTWESNSGSKVVARRLEGCSPDSTAIPWLLLQAVSTTGPGIFSSVTYVQRVNTTGGLAPAIPGSSVGAVVEVPYTAEYYFYRGQD